MSGKPSESCWLHQVTSQGLHLLHVSSISVLRKVILWITEFMFSMIFRIFVCKRYIMCSLCFFPILLIDVLPWYISICLILICGFNESHNYYLFGLSQEKKKMKLEITVCPLVCFGYQFRRSWVHGKSELLFRGKKKWFTDWVRAPFPFSFFLFPSPSLSSHAPLALLNYFFSFESLK